MLDGKDVIHTHYYFEQRERERQRAVQSTASIPSLGQSRGGNHLLRDTAIQGLLLLLLLLLRQASVVAVVGILGAGATHFFLLVVVWCVLV